jgi:hypothetical protein
MSQFKGLTEERGMRLACQPQNFRTYLGEYLRGMIARNNNKKWFLFEHRPDITWTPEMLHTSYIIENGREIDLSSLQLDEKESYPDHFYGITAGPLEHNHHFKTMFILGAGASFDCISSTSTSLQRVPLSNNIFTSDPFKLISEHYPAVHQKYSQLSLTENLEKYFTQRWKRLGVITRRDELAELMNIQFYLHHLFLAYSNSYYGNSACNYRALIEKIHDHCTDTGEKLAIVSYNYDCIVDQAIESRYGAINSIEEYLANESKPISLLKPHGSCDWVRPIETKFNHLLDTGYADRPDNDVRLVNMAQRILQNQLSMADIHNITEDKLLLFHNITNQVRWSGMFGQVLIYKYNC